MSDVPIVESDDQLQILTTTAAAMYAMCLHCLPDPESRYEWEFSSFLPAASRFLKDLEGESHD